MYQSFRKLDQKATGYITLDDIYKLCNEDLRSVVAPYIESFFGRIKKEYKDRVSFIELMPTIAAFCLYTKKQILEFVFTTLDLDDDGNISKTDILQFLFMERLGERIFPNNFAKAVEFLPLERSDKVN